MTAEILTIPHYYVCVDCKFLHKHKNFTRNPSVPCQCTCDCTEPAYRTVEDIQRKKEMVK